MELHDSQIQNIKGSGANLRIEFSQAYIHRSQGRPGIDPGTVWLQEAEFVIMEGFDNYEELIGQEIQDGILKLGEKVYENLIPVPLDFEDEVELSLVFSNAKSVFVRGRGMHLRLQGEPQFVERFPGTPSEPTEGFEG